MEAEVPCLDKIHHNLVLPSAWQHQAAVEVNGFVPDADPSMPELTSRASLTIDGSAFSLSLRPTADQLLQLADLLTALARDLEHAEISALGQAMENIDRALVGLPPQPSAEGAAPVTLTAQGA